MPNNFPNARDIMYGANEKLEELVNLSIEETLDAMKVKKYDYTKTMTLRAQESDFLMQEKELAKETRRYITSSPYLHEEMLDCTPKYMRKRAESITKYTKYIHTKYSSQYPNLCVEDIFMDVNAMSNVVTIDYIDRISFVTYAIAIWILDQLLIQGDLNKAILYLPDVPEDSFDGLPPFTDSCHDDELIERLLYLIKNRNTDTNNKKDIGRVFLDSTTLSLKEKRTYKEYEINDSLTMRQRFDSIISLIYLPSIEKAIARFNKSTFDFFELCLELVNEYRTQELSICKKRLNSLEHQKNIILNSNKENQQSSSALLVNNLVKIDEMMSELERKISFAEFSKELLESGSERIRLADLQRHIAVAACMPDVIKIMADEGSVDRTVYDKLSSFEVLNPYETLFALLYLFDSGDEIVWLYNQSFFIEKIAAYQLPWIMGNNRKRDWEDDVDNRDDNIEKDSTVFEHDTKEEPALYSKTYSDASLWRDPKNAKNGFEKMNLPQIIFEHTNVVMPRYSTLNCDLTSRLEQSGFSSSEATALEKYITLCRSNQNKEMECDLLYHDFGDVVGDEDDFSEDEIISKKSDDVAELKKEIERLKNELHLLHSDRNSYKKQAESLLSENDELKHELVELKDIIHTSSDNRSSNTEKKKIQYPYTLKNKYVVYGGHPSWLREIKKLLNNIRFIDGTVLPNQNLMINSKAVWIQSNAIGHAFYYKILDVTRTHNIPLEYFSYASAEKCAEQIVEYDKSIKD